MSDKEFTVHPQLTYWERNPGTPPAGPVSEHIINVSQTFDELLPANVAAIAVIEQDGHGATVFHEIDDAKAMGLLIHAVEALAEHFGKHVKVTIS